MVAGDVGDFWKRDHSFDVGWHAFDGLVEGFGSEEEIEEEGDD